MTTHDHDMVMRKVGIADLKAHLSEHHIAPASAQEMQAPGIARTRS